MRLTAFAVFVSVAAVLLGAALVAVPAGAKTGASIRILFDLGDGSYVWANETIDDPAAPNATRLAVEHAAQASGIAIEASYFDCCGVGISDLGERHSPAGLIGLYVWDADAGVWDFASSGISGLVVRDGDAIALYNAGYDSVTFDGRRPVPTPDHPLPALQFRGDLANGGTSVSPAPDRDRIVWARDTGVREIGSTPAVAYGAVFVTTMHGLLALDERTGQTRWSNPVAEGFSSPAVFDGSVIVGTSNGTVVRLNATDGSSQWETRLLAETSFSGITSSPKVAYDCVLIGTFNESGGAGEVVSLWASNGTVAWRHATGSVDYSSPAYANGTVYVGIMGTYNTTTQVTFDPPYGVVALDASTGAEKWFFETSGPVAASPALAGPKVVVTSKDGNVYALNATTGVLAWQFGSGEWKSVSSPAVRGDTVFAAYGTFDGKKGVVALSLETGAQRWYMEPNGPVQSSITYADGKVFFSTNAANGTIYALNASNGRTLWTFEPTPSDYILGSPVVADGMVFAPSDNGYVYAIGEGPVLSSVPGLTLGVLEVGVMIAVVVSVVAVAVFVVLRRSRGGP